MVVMTTKKPTFLKIAEDINNYYCFFAIVTKFSKSTGFVNTY